MVKKKVNNSGNNKKTIFAIVVIFLLVMATMLTLNNNKDSSKKTASNDNQNGSKIQLTVPNNSQTKNAGDTTSGADLIIPKSEVTETAKFYPYKVDNVNMEVVAIKAKDGTIRTALNTCQVCYTSGKGYYKQNGDTLVCQNCGNVFKIDQVEKIKNGCNPVPVTGNDKKDDGSNIVISKTFLASSKNLFLNWRK